MKYSENSKCLENWKYSEYCDNEERKEEVNEPFAKCRFLRNLLGVYVYTG